LIKTAQLSDRATGAVLARRVEIADTFWARFRGLQFRRELPPDTAILLEPCSSVHTFFMRFAIDVAFLDSDMRVIRVRRKMRPWRATWPVRGAKAVVECTAGAIQLEVGQTLAISNED